MSCGLSPFPRSKTLRVALKVTRQYGNNGLPRRVAARIEQKFRRNGQKGYGGQMDADWPKEGEGDDECKITVYGNDVLVPGLTARRGIYCWQHTCWAVGTFRDNREAYRYFRCDHGQALRFMFVDTSPLVQYALPPEFGDLTEVVRIYTMHLEERAHGGDNTEWALYIIRRNSVGVPTLHQCKVAMVEDSGYSEIYPNGPLYKSVLFKVEDENGQPLTQFSISVNGDA
jgi:hypothetical protein